VEFLVFTALYSKAFLESLILHSRFQEVGIRTQHRKLLGTNQICMRYRERVKNASSDTVMCCFFNAGLLWWNSSA